MTYFSRFGRAVAACFVATLAAFLLAGRTDATSIRLPLSEISVRSPVVVRGRVERIESAWNGERQIESTVYVRTSEILRGRLSGGALIPVRVYGGTIDGLTMVSSEEPEFEAGEDVLLFLSESEGHAYRPTADQQGKFKIVGDRAVNRAWQAGVRLAELKDGVVHGWWSAATGLPHASLVPSESPTESALPTAPAWEIPWRRLRRTLMS